MAEEAVLAAEFQEWAFQGFLKRIRIRDDVTHNLKFKLPLISEHLRLLIDPNVLDINHNAAKQQAPLKPKKSKVLWVEDDIELVHIWNKGRSWDFTFTLATQHQHNCISLQIVFELSPSIQPEQNLLAGV